MTEESLNLLHDIAASAPCINSVDQVDPRDLFWANKANPSEAATRSPVDNDAVVYADEEYIDEYGNKRELYKKKLLKMHHNQII